MGDIADMMLDGTLCETCGVVLASELEGFPQICGQCANELEQKGYEIRNTGANTWQIVNTPRK